MQFASLWLIGHAGKFESDGLGQAFVNMYAQAHHYFSQMEYVIHIKQVTPSLHQQTSKLHFITGLFLGLDTLLNLIK